MNDFVLLVDDEQEILKLLESHLSKVGLTCCACSSAEDALIALKKTAYSAVITDLKMTGLNGIELCDRICGNYPDLPVLILTAFGTLDVAVEAIRAGAYDFIAKPLDFDALSQTVLRAVRNYKAKAQARLIEHQDNSSPLLDKPIHEIIGQSRSSEELRQLVAQVASLSTTVLVSGESGTGKELIARTLHKQGANPLSPFVVADCANLSHDDFEKRLFGWSESALKHHIGIIESAANGTIFFDEIARLPLQYQAKLLRLLEQKTYRSVGGNDEKCSTARFIVSTNENLEDAVNRGEFLKDLLFRINVIHIRLLPLRERTNDILVLSKFFLTHFATQLNKSVESISEPVIEKLVSYHWPGNVRELRNAMERAVGLANNNYLVADDLPEPLQAYRVSNAVRAEDPNSLVSVDTIEERHILSVLKEVNGNKALAAKILKMGRKTLYRKLERYGYKGN